MSKRRSEILENFNTQASEVSDLQRMLYGANASRQPTASGLSPDRVEDQMSVMRDVALQIIDQLENDGVDLYSNDVPPEKCRVKESLYNIAHMVLGQK